MSTKKWDLDSNILKSSFRKKKSDTLSQDKTIFQIIYAILQLSTK